MKLSEKYQQWRQLAGLIVKQFPRPPAIDGPIRIDLVVKKDRKWSRRKHDIDNLIKPLLDFLVMLNYLPDDNSDIVKAITIVLDSEPDPVAGIWVRIQPHRDDDHATPIRRCDHQMPGSS